MTHQVLPEFDQPDIAPALDALTPEDLDQLPFGVIGFDQETLVCKYNAEESRMAGLAPERVLAAPLFTAVAPCMNNFMVAQRFDDAIAQGSRLDVFVDYVFTLRMRPSKVRLRLLAAPDMSTRYVLVSRRG